MSEGHTIRCKKRTSQQSGLVSDVGFGKFLKLLHSVSAEGLISLGVGEPDFATPQHICQAAFEATAGLHRICP